MNKAQRKLIFPAIIAFIITSVFCFTALFQRGEAPQAEIQGASQPITETTAPAVTAAPAASTAPDYDIDCDRLRISEVLLLNSAVLPDCRNSFNPYIELQNISDAALELENWTLKADGEEYVFPQRQLEAGEFLIVFLGGSNCDTELHAELSPAADSKLVLANPHGCTAQEFTCVNSLENLSLCLEESGEISSPMLPSPGFENSNAGYAAFSAQRSPDSLAISEVCPAQGFVELKNLSDSNAYLSDYLLSDSPDFSSAKKLEGGALGSGQGHVFYISETALPLSLKEGAVYLFDKSGKMLDYISLAAIPGGGSCGRQDGEQGFFFFTTPSPWQSNFSGKRFISSRPQLLVSDDGRSVSIEAEGKVYYTLDGSLPTQNSSLYQSTLNLSAPAVLRCIALAEDSIASESISMSFLNDSAGLQLSLAVDDYGEFNAICQRMLQYREMTADLEIITAEGRLCFACTVSPVPVDGKCAYRVKATEAVSLSIIGEECSSLLIIPESGDAASGSLWINARAFGGCRYQAEG